MWSPPFPPEEFDDYDDETGMGSQVRLAYLARYGGVYFSESMPCVPALQLQLNFGWRLLRFKYRGAFVMASAIFTSW